jgi:hypothetical protein
LISSDNVWSRYGSAAFHVVEQYAERVPCLRLSGWANSASQVLSSKPPTNTAFEEFLARAQAAGLAQSHDRSKMQGKLATKDQANARGKKFRELIR